VARLMGGEKAALMATDPPYGVGYDPAERSRAKATARVRGDERADWGEAFALGAAPVAVVWFACLFAREAQEAVQRVGLTIIRHVVWVKPYGQMQRRGYHWQHENAWVAVRDALPWYGDRKQTTVWQATPPGDPYGRGEAREGNHPTQKPAELFAIPIRNHTKPGELCYEPFSGSGTQIVAAEALGRRCFALEIEPRYVDVGIRRWEKLTGKHATLDGTGRTFASVANERGVALPPTEASEQTA